MSCPMSFLVASRVDERYPGANIQICVLRCFLAAGEAYDAWPTEGGHAEMSPRDDLEYDLMKASAGAHLGSSTR